MERNPLKRLGGLLFAAATALALISCNGSSGPTGATGTNGTNGTNGAAGAAGANGANGTNGSAPAINVAQLTQDEWSALALSGNVTSVNLAGTTPVVNFTVTTSNGVPVAGLSANTSKASTALYTSYANFAFSIAKLVPTPTLTPSVTNTTWVSYLIDSTPTVAAPTATPGKPTTDNTGTLTEDGNGNYSYTFFRNIKGEAAWLALPATQALITAANTAKPGSSIAADLGDVSFNAALTHRVGIQISGSFRGTGSNTPDTTGGAPAANVLQAANILYDFVPNGNAITTERQIVNVAACNACHTQLGASFTNSLTGTAIGGFHSGARVDPNFCLFCHNSQMMYGQVESLPASVTTMTFTAPSGKLQGMSVGELPAFIHKIHMGANLGYANYNFGVAFNSVWYPQDVRKCTTCHQAVYDSNNNLLNPQYANWQNVPSRLACGACHDTVNFATGVIAPGGTNALNGQLLLHGQGLGGPQADDTRCFSCHGPADIATYHMPLMNPVENGSNISTRGSIITNSWQATDPTNLPAGATPITYNITSLTVNASHQPVIQFNIQATNITTGVTASLPITPYATAVLSATGANSDMIPGYAYGPELGLQMGLPQDGLLAPVDYNANKEISWTLKSIWNGTAVSAGATLVSSTGITAIGTTGNYQIILDGIQVPSTVTTFAMGIGWSPLVQTSLTTSSSDLNHLNENTAVPSSNLFGWTPATASTVPPISNVYPGTGGLMLPAVTVWTNWTGGGNKGRRAIIVKNSCNACHGDLGAFTPTLATASTNYNVNGYAVNFHDAYMNDGTSCVFCHTTAGTDSGWSYNAKSWLHGIHSAGFRTNAFTAHSSSQFWNITYPGLLNDCEACHVPGSYDFSNSANAAAIPNMLWDTTAASNLSSGYLATPAPGTKPSGAAGSKYLAPWVTALNYGSAFAAAAPTPASQSWVITQPSATSLVTSPITASCAGCHDAPQMISHMTTNGGFFNVPRSNFPPPTAAQIAAAGANAAVQYPAGTVVLPTNSEQCLVCHSAGGVADIRNVHMNFYTAN
jgi:OmcA/MtrC family decaheme c-type cytochrome